MNAPMQKRTMSGIQEYSTDVEEIRRVGNQGRWIRFWSIKSRSIPAQNQAAGQARYESLKGGGSWPTPTPHGGRSRFASATCATTKAVSAGRPGRESASAPPLMRRLQARRQTVSKGKSIHQPQSCRRNRRRTGGNRCTCGQGIGTAMMTRPLIRSGISSTRKPAT